MKNNKIKMDFFGDGMRIFLDYISRQTKKNPSYKPHSLIRAFEMAMHAIEKVNYGENVIGVSQEGNEGGDSISNPYAVVLQKRKDGIEVKEIINLIVNKPLPVNLMIITFRLQIQLDKIEGDTISPEEMAGALNSVIPGSKFYVLGDGWREAIKRFMDLTKEGKIHIPNDPELINELSKINLERPWEDYPNRVRAFIGGGNCI